MAQSSQFSFPPGVRPARACAKLTKTLGLQRLPAQVEQRVYLDTFDWRLHKRGWILRVDQRDEERVAQLWDKQGELLAAARLEGLPKFAADLPAGRLRSKIAPVLDVRALLSVAAVEVQLQPLSLTNRDDKTVARLSLEAAQLGGQGSAAGSKLPARLCVDNIKGYPKAAKRVAAALEQLGLAAVEESLMVPALAASGRSPGDYDDRFEVALTPDMTAGQATRALLARLVTMIDANWEGTRDDIDSEFLHDFRVAVRRTRTLLRGMGSVFRANRVGRFSEDFKWLGGVTSTPRDMDVLMIELPQYAADVPAASAAELSPLSALAGETRGRSQTELSKVLVSKRYRDMMSRWRRFVGGVQVAAEGSKPAVEVASRAIWKAYRRVYKDGRRVHDETPAQELHDLRKRCKRLRYLIEGYRSLYPAGELNSWISTLKRLQTILGEIQDLDVHISQLRTMAGQLPADEPSTTPALLALGAMLQTMAKRRVRARQKLAPRLKTFVSADNREAARHLFMQPQTEGEAS